MIPGQTPPARTLKRVSKWLTVDFECSLCKVVTKTVRFIKPTIFQATILNTVCSGCESRHALKIERRANVKDRNQVFITIMGVFRSEKWKALVAKEAKGKYQVGW